MGLFLKEWLRFATSDAEVLYCHGTGWVFVAYDGHVSIWAVGEDDPAAEAIPTYDLLEKCADLGIPENVYGQRYFAGW